MNKFLNSRVGVTVTLLVAGAGGLYFLSKKAENVVDSINPNNPDNVISEAVNAQGLGRWIYDVFNGTKPSLTPEVLHVSYFDSEWKLKDGIEQILIKNYGDNLSDFFENGVLMDEYRHLIRGV